MIIKYEFKKNKIGQNDYYEEEYFEVEDFYYDVSKDDIEFAVAEIFSNEYDISQNTAKKIINDFDLEDLISDEYYEEVYSIVQEICWEKAYLEWNKKRGTYIYEK